jgi:predicted nucleic acid-binding protein
VTVVVVDTSAVVDALIGGPAPALVSRLADGADLHAPHLIDVEVLHVLRRLVRSEVLSEERALDARHDFDDLRLLRYAHSPLTERAWELRHNVTAYDAMFVVLAEALRAPLVTCDAALAAAAAGIVEVELFRPPPGRPLS